MALKCVLQLQSVREILRFDPVGTIEKAADTGFKYIELINHDADASPDKWYGMTAGQIASLADSAGIKIIGGYVDNLNTGNAKAVMEYYAEIGNARIVIPIDYFPNRKTLDEKCVLYNELGHLCKENGLSLFYENHYHEFQTVEGGMIFDLLLAQTRPELFSISLNQYWLMRGLVEPVDTLKKYASRVGSIVLQDYPLDEIDKINMWNFWRFHPIAKNINKDIPLKGGEIKNINPVQCMMFTEIGNGIIKMQPMIDTANALGGIDYAILKQDYTRLPSEFESIQVTYDNARRMKGLSWD